MHDVIIDETKTSLAATANLTPQRERKPQPKQKPKKKRSFSVYLLDLLEKTLILACLLSIDFLAFTGAGSYQMFDSATFFTMEVWYILVGIFAVSFLLAYLLSFWTFLQNVVISAVVALFVTVMLNQFAAFDKNSMLASLVATYVSQDVGLLFTYVSHVILSIVIGIFFLLFLSFSSKKLVACFVLGLSCILVLVVFAQKKSSVLNQKYNVVMQDIKTVGEKSGKRFIFIGLPTAGGYNYLNDVIQEQAAAQNELENLRKSRDIVLGFYAKNGFMMYPHAYVNDLDENHNWGQILNLTTTKNPYEYMQKNISTDRFWKFSHLAPKYVFLKKNKLYETFHKGKFGINAYQSGGVEMCKINNEMVVSRCVEKNGQPIDFDGMNLSLEQKIEVLLAQWVESMDLFDDFSYPYNLLKPFVDVETLPTVGLSYKSLEAKNSLEVLDRVLHDMDNDTGNKAYFVNLNMPGDMFIYDEFCRIKPLEKWRSKTDNTWVRKMTDSQKRAAYADQLRCVYGALEKFMNNLQQSEAGKNSVVVLQGMSGINGMASSEERDFLQELKNKKYVDMAIKDPLKGGFKVAQDICSAPNILKKYLYRQESCPELKEFNLHADTAKNFAASLRRSSIDEAMAEKAKKTFDEWYSEWQKNQSRGVLKASDLLQLKKKEAAKDAPAAEKKADASAEKEPAQTQAEKVTDVVAEKAVGKAQSMAKPLQEQAEAAVEKLPIKVEADAAKAEASQKQPAAANDNIPLENKAKAE